MRSHPTLIVGVRFRTFATVLWSRSCCLVSTSTFANPALRMRLKGADVLELDDLEVGLPN